MERLNKAVIKSGRQYDHLFPEPDWKDTVVKGSANLADTMKLIPGVVNKTLEDTEKLVSEVKGRNTYETAKNIWHFVYDHIPYRRDEKGKEQIRRPSRSWFERETRKDGSEGGVDCDCYTVFISSLLTNLGINHTLRVTKNTKDYFQHIYPIIPIGSGRYITIDCVVDEFNYEAPFKEKIDHNMELHYLSGLDDETAQSEMYDYEDDEIRDYTDAESVDVEDFINGIDDADLEELGFLRKLRKKVGKAIKKVGKKVGKVAKKALHVINRINPAAVLLRNGLLAAMKLNMFKVAERIKYAYLTEGQAKGKNLKMDKYKKLHKAKERLEKIFHGAGGKPSNLRKAILKGKGNKNKEVAGLGEIFDGGNYDENSSLEEILGPELFYEEMAVDFDQVEGLGELGEVATGAAIASATAAVGAIAKLLDKIGDVRDKAKTVLPLKRPAPPRTPVAQTTLPVQTRTVSQPAPVRPATPRTTTAPTRSASTSVTTIAPTSSIEARRATPVEQSVPTSSEEKKGLVEWVKENPVKAGLAGAGILVAGYGVYHVASGGSKKGSSLSGVGRKRRTTTTSAKRKTKKPVTKKATTKRRSTRRSKPKTQKKVAIALM